MEYMFFLCFIIFLIVSYILPFESFHLLWIIFNDNTPDSALAIFIFSTIMYLILYIIRAFFFIILAIISFKFKNSFTILYKYNFLTISLTLIVDLFLYNNLDILLNIDLLKSYGIVSFFCFLSLSSTYFPFWLVFGIRNLIHYIKGLKNKKSE